MRDGGEFDCPISILADRLFPDHQAIGVKDHPLKFQFEVKQNHF